MGRAAIAMPRLNQQPPARKLRRLLIDMPQQFHFSHAKLWITVAVIVAIAIVIALAVLYSGGGGGGGGGGGY